MVIFFGKNGYILVKNGNIFEKKVILLVSYILFGYISSGYIIDSYIFVQNIVIF